MKNILNFLLAALLVAGCKKMPSSVGQRDLEATGLSGCPGGECNFLYSEWGDVDTLKSEVTSGRFRIFRSAYSEEGIPVEIIIKAPMEGIAFSLSNLQLASGWGIWQATCPECRLRPLRISGGSVRGNRIARDNMAGPEKWVLELKLDISQKNGGYKRPVHIKQVFYPDFIRPEKTAGGT